MKSQLGTWRSDLVSVLARYERFGSRRRYRRGQVLYEQGVASPLFYVVLNGLVQISIMRPDGIEIVLELMGPKTICGEGAAFDGQPRFSRAVALQATEAIEFDTGRLRQAFREHPEFAIVLFQVTSLKQRVLANRLEQLASREPEGRILELFVRLSTMFAASHPKGTLLATRLTHEQIAAMTGTTRVTVTRTLQRLRRSGEIDIVEGRILLKEQHSRHN